jgi:hypothetical protein
MVEVGVMVEVKVKVEVEEVKVKAKIEGKCNSTLTLALTFIYIKLHKSDMPCSQNLLYPFRKRPMNLAGKLYLQEHYAYIPVSSE